MNCGDCGLGITRICPAAQPAAAALRWTASCESLNPKSGVWCDLTTAIALKVCYTHSWLATLGPAAAIEALLILVLRLWHLAFPTLVFVSAEAAQLLLTLQKLQRVTIGKRQTKRISYVPSSWVHKGCCRIEPILLANGIEALQSPRLQKLLGFSKASKLCQRQCLPNHRWVSKCSQLMKVHWHPLTISIVTFHDDSSNTWKTFLLQPRRARISWSCCIWRLVADAGKQHIFLLLRTFSEGNNISIKFCTEKSMLRLDPEAKVRPLVAALVTQRRVARIARLLGSLSLSFRKTFQQKEGSGTNGAGVASDKY